MGWTRMECGVNYGKRKIAERKIAKPMPQKNAATHTEAQKSSMAVATPEKITSAWMKLMLRMKTTASI